MKNQSMACFLPTAQAKTAAISLHLAVLYGRGLREVVVSCRFSVFSGAGKYPGLPLRWRAFLMADVRASQWHRPYGMARP
ncbi:MAG: hypothetical protein WD645_03850, partial [Dehalococcoidia bacterium]